MKMKMSVRLKSAGSEGADSLRSSFRQLSKELLINTFAHMMLMAQGFQSNLLANSSLSLYIGLVIMGCI